LAADLQRFAKDDSKTEKATPKKRSDARKKGQVFHSKEISTAVVLLFAFLLLRAFGGYIYERICYFFLVLLPACVADKDLFTVSGVTALFTTVILEFVLMVLPLIALIAVIGALVAVAQVGFLFAPEAIKPKASKINPIKGLQRMFSLKSLVELIKNLVKIAVVVYIAYTFVMGSIDEMIGLMGVDAFAAFSAICAFTLDVAIRICAVLVVFGVIDYIIQWRQYENNLKMSKHEVKEEYKQMEGNPQVRSKIKQKQREISMRRMMQEVPSADVVITNPTHYAVAVRYDPDASDAPVVVAKGQDFIAMRIREVAKAHGVTVYESRMLARALYEGVDIGKAIPPEFYQAVADILAFVYGLKGRTAV